MSAAARTSRYRETELGIEARCSKCGEFWPADGEFFFTCKGRVHSWCKDCYLQDLVAKGKRPGYGNGHTKCDHARTG